MPTPTPRRPSLLRRRCARALNRAGAVRAGAVLAAATVAAGLLLGVAAPAGATPTPPPNPSDAQIGAAQTQKTALATKVGALTAQLSQQQAEVEELQNQAEAAEQAYAYAVQQLDEATAAAATAKQAVATAQAAVQSAHSAFNATVRADYTQASVQGGAGALLAADDPDEVLQSAAFQSYVTDHQADGIGQLDRAKVAKANADAAARTAVATQARLTTQADQAMQDARSAESAAEVQEKALTAAQTSTRSQLAVAYNQLQTLLGQRQTYNDYVAEQARIKAEQERQREIAQQAARDAAAARLAQQQAQSGSGGSGGSSGGGASSGDPSGGSWTAARGQAAVDRAMAFLGTRYSFAAGNYNGPTYGHCGTDDAGWNDCHVFGFDCSGLVLYAWAPYIHMAHYTVRMWTDMSGNYHPSTSDLMPGDLLFYGGNTESHPIHHVAMYIGNGTVIQAPQSGDVVKTTSIWNMGSDYYGAIRPLT